MEKLSPLGRGDKRRKIVPKEARGIGGGNRTNPLSPPFVKGEAVNLKKGKKLTPL